MTQRRVENTHLAGGVPERPKGTDCKSVGSAFGGSNPPPSTNPFSGAPQVSPRKGWCMASSDIESGATRLVRQIVELVGAGSLLDARSAAPKGRNTGCVSQSTLRWSRLVRGEFGSRTRRYAPVRQIVELVGAGSLLHGRRAKHRMCFVNLP